MKTVVLIPTYNERENIRALIPRVVAAVPTADILVIDDNSPDNTSAEVLELSKKFPQVKLLKRPGKSGLGRAYMDAFRQVLADKTIDAVCTMDADLSHNPESLPLMLERLERADAVIGSRYVPGGTIEGWEPWRKLLSAWGNRYCRTITRLPIKDCTSGFSCVGAKNLRQMDWSDFDASGYAFLIYLKFKLWKNGARLDEYPIHFKNRLTGESKISFNIIEEGLLLPWRLIKKSPADARCPLCNSVSTKYWFSKNNCPLYRCGDCQLIFVYPVPTDYHTVYSQDYFCGAAYGHGYVHYEQEKNADQHTFARYLDIIQKYHTQHGKLLDVGAATGAFVAAAEKNGWQASGLEISDFAASTARAMGRAVITGTLENTPLPSDSYQAITLWDVFEHIAQPEPTLAAVNRLLTVGGLAIFNTPNATSLSAKILGRFWPLIIPPEHLRLYNPKNFSQLLKQHNFEVLLITTVGKRFTLSYIFQVASTVWHSAILKKISARFNRPSLNKLSIPLNLRDNMLVVTRKINARNK